MVYECILCNTLWSFDDNPDFDNISSGYCAKCIRTEFKNKIHNWQLRDSGFDCFGTAYDYCDQSECMFRHACIETNIHEWEQFILQPL